ncbi:uncharacterized protein LOC111636287 [Centruroides sculpturatus]|uniref:uncharacterized protein LOC111636287 n=1 Tax=Centruroides sculpturatus TaxID=218467 RepID=UPI000C6D7C80|nr:uncharacterized protein LOC111636287 [Centruroides sculpturatus]XP_023237268.1 uncharacterized protein LOC111636287 [Centruroides sculpturatus]
MAEANPTRARSDSLRALSGSLEALWKENSISEDNYIQFNRNLDTPSCDTPYTENDVQLTPSLRNRSHENDEVSIIDSSQSVASGNYEEISSSRPQSTASEIYEEIPSTPPQSTASEIYEEIPSTPPQNNASEVYEEISSFDVTSADDTNTTSYLSKCLNSVKNVKQNFGTLSVIGFSIAIIIVSTYLYYIHFQSDQTVFFKY